MRKEKTSNVKVLITIISTAFFVLFLGFLSLEINQRFDHQPTAVAGTIDVSNVDLENQMVVLDGEWSFYWEKLLDPVMSSRFLIVPDLYAPVPSVWNSYEIEDQPISGQGYASYTLMMTGLVPNQRYGIRVDSMSTAYNLYVDATLVASNGVVGTSASEHQSFNKPQTAFFTAQSEAMMLVLHVSNFDYARGGFWYDVSFGLEDQITRLNNNILFKDAFMLGALFLITLYLIVFFIMLKDIKKAITFFLLSVMITIRILIYGQYLIVSMFEQFYYPLLVWANYLSFTWIPILFYFISRIMFFEGMKSKWSIVVFGYGFIISLAILLLPISVVTGWIYWLNVASTLITVLTIFMVFQTNLKNKHNMIIFATGLIMILVLGLHDWLMHANVVSSTWGELNTIGVINLFFLYGIIQSNDMVEAFAQEAILSNELKKSNSSQKLLQERIKQYQEVFTQADDDYRVLYLDDDITKVKQMFELLKELNIQVDHLSSVQDQIITPAYLSMFDLVVLNIEAFNMEGFKILKSIRTLFNVTELPVLAIIPDHNYSLVKIAQNLGTNDFVFYPFNIMSVNGRIKGLIALKRSVKKAVENELYFLMAQIKPHFLYNALSVISSLSLRDPEKSKKLILDLSDYLRASFDFKDKNGLVFLYDELKLVDAYLAIEKARFENRLTIVKDIDDLPAIKIPVLTIQPLIENAINHGLVTTAKGGTVILSIKAIEDKIVIKITDNGVGIEPSKSKQIFDHQSSGVGLKNIHQRLLTVYGSGLSIISEANRFTEVSFEIPKES